MHCAIQSIDRATDRYQTNHRLSGMTARGLKLLLLLLVLGGTATVQPLMADGLSVSGTVGGIPETLPAHQSGQACFTVDGFVEEEDLVFLTLEGPRGEVGGKTGIPDDETSICFTIPPVPYAGEWDRCTPPRSHYRETYVATATIDRSDGITRRQGPKLDDYLAWTIERPVTKKDPRPNHCRDEGNWSWTFKAGELTCRSLPMKVPLKGFTGPVFLETDGIEMRVSGTKTADQILLINQGDAKLRGQVAGKYKGTGILIGAPNDEIQGDARYELRFVEGEYLEGQLTLDNAPYQGDVCSIRWPFTAKPIKNGS